MLVVHLLFTLRLALNNSRSFLHATWKEDEVSTPIKVLSYLSKPLLRFYDAQPEFGDVNLPVLGTRRYSAENVKDDFLSHYGK